MLYRGRRRGTTWRELRMPTSRRELTRLHDERGLALLETAIVLPILILLLFAIVELGLTFARLQVITNASAAGARAAGLFIQNCSEAAMAEAARRAIQPFGGRLGLPDQLNGTLDGSCTDPTVRFTVTFASPIPIVSAFAQDGSGGPLGIPTSIDLSQQTTEFNSNSLGS